MTSNKGQPLPSGFQVHWHKPSDCQEWDSFVVGCPSVHHEQLSRWATVREFQGWQPTLATLHYGQRLIGGCLVIIRGRKRIQVGYVSRGPLINSGDEKIDTAATEILTSELRQFAARVGLAYLVVDLPYWGQKSAGPLLSRGFIRHIRGLPPSGLPTSVITIDLTPPVDEILGNMSKTTRKSIRQAERRGVTIRGGDRADLSILWDLMMALCARRGVRSNVDNIEFMTHLWDVFSPGKRAQLFVAEVEQAPVAALLTIKAGDWIHLWRMGWSGAFPDKHPTKALLWHAAREAREEGCTVADLNWAESEVAEAIKAGDATSGNPNAGVTQYKLGFGGQVVRLPGAYTYFPNPIVRAFFRMGGERVVTSRLGARLLRGRRRLT